MRDARLHIRKSVLKRILHDIGIMFPVDTVEQIFDKAKEYPKIPTNIQVTAKTAKQADRSKAAEGAMVSVFNRILDGVRMEAGHKMVTQIRQGDASYIMLKEIAHAAHQFGELFNITPMEMAYKKFCQIGLDLLGKKFALNKLKYHVDKIVEVAEAMQIIERDTDSEGTTLFRTCYLNNLKKFTTVNIDDTLPTRYVYYIYGRDEADKAGARYEDWVNAQFEQLAFLDAVPELGQLFGPNAKLRFEKYAIKQHIKSRDKHMEELGKMDDEQKAYFDALKELKKKRAQL